MPKIVRSDPESFQPLQLSSFEIYAAESRSEKHQMNFPRLRHKKRISFSVSVLELHS